MRTTALIIGIVVCAVGCDKAASKKVPVVQASINLDAHPDIVFHVFGERQAPRMMPLAAIQGNQIVEITLPPEGWRRLDADYMKAATTYPVFADGGQSGTVTVDRGMWTDAPAYALPGCVNPTPMAQVTLHDTSTGNTIEAFATTRAAVAHPHGKPLSRDSVRFIAKHIGYQVGRGVGLDSTDLDALDFRAVAIETHAHARPTIVVSFIDPRGGDDRAGGGKTADVLAIADDDSSGYKVSFSHAFNGGAASAEYRSYLDHLDLTGDGTDEILIEGWRQGEQTAPRILAWRNGTWREIFVGRSSWCLDPPGK